VHSDEQSVKGSRCRLGSWCGPLAVLNEQIDNYVAFVVSRYTDILAMSCCASTEQLRRCCPADRDASGYAIALPEYDMKPDIVRPAFGSSR
jgi:hypothetical protein